MGQRKSKSKEETEHPRQCGESIRSRALGYPGLPCDSELRKLTQPKDSKYPVCSYNRRSPGKASVFHQGIEPQGMTQPYCNGSGGKAAEEKGRRQSGWRHRPRRQAGDGAKTHPPRPQRCLTPQSQFICDIGKEKRSTRELQKNSTRKVPGQQKPRPALPVQQRQARNSRSGPENSHWYRKR